MVYHWNDVWQKPQPVCVWLTWKMNYSLLSFIFGNKCQFPKSNCDESSTSVSYSLLRYYIQLMSNIHPDTFHYNIGSIIQTKLLKVFQMILNFNFISLPELLITLRRSTAYSEQLLYYLYVWWTRKIHMNNVELLIRYHTCLKYSCNEVTSVFTVVYKATTNISLFTSKCHKNID